jgi:signal transduction histidine kinase
VLRELLSNVGRHAHARQAWVTVRIDGGQLLLLVRDDGVGTDGTNPGTGTRTIRERAERLHGTVTVSSQAGAGTTVQWMVPLQAAPADQADSSG